MAELTVVVAPPGPCAHVRAALIDWSAVGLVSPFAWVEPAMITGAQIGALSISAGETTGSSLQALVTAARVDVIRLVVLVPVVTGAEVVSADDEQRVLNLLSSSSGGARVSRIRLALVRHGDPATSADLAHAGWHNVLLSPEQAAGPERGRDLLGVSAGDRGLGAHGAAGLAGLAGLWTGLDGAPLDEVEMLPGESVRLARTFYRRLQSERLEAELRRRVTLTSDSLPLPVEAGPTSVYIDDEALATSTMADAFWKKHAHVLRGPRETRPSIQPTPLGVLAALRLFFGFLGAAVRNAPAQWYRATVARVSSRAAAVVHSAIFGDKPSAWAVVVNGVAADGLPARWHELAGAADAIGEVFEDDPRSREHQTRTDLSTTWADYAAAALTLADAGERVAELPPVVIGTQRAVLRRADLIVPAPEARFDGVPGHIAARVDSDPVDAYDVLAINDLHRRLVSVQNDDLQLGLDASRSDDELLAWTAKHRTSFATRVGEAIGGAIQRTNDEIRDLLERFKAASGGDETDRAALDTQARLARFIRVVSVVFLALIVVDVVLFARHSIEPKWFWIALAVLVVIWFLIGSITFYRSQRELFRLLNARKEAAEQVEIDRRNLRQAVRDLRRLTDAYGQFLAWSRAIGTLLDAPLGTPTDTLHDDTRLSPALPLGVSLGSALVDDNTLADAVVMLRRQVFRVGWLDEPWESLTWSAAQTIGADAYELRDNPRALFGLSAESGSLLSRWVELIGGVAVESEVADRVWRATRDALGGAQAHLVSPLLKSIVPLGRPDALALPLGDFLAKVDAPDSVDIGATFDVGELTSEAQAGTTARIASTWGRRNVDGLSVVATMAQLSGGSPPYSFTAFGGAAILPTTPDPTPAPEPLDGLDGGAPQGFRF